MKWVLAFVVLGTGLALAQDITGGLNNTPKQLLKGGLNNSFGVIVGGGGGGGGGTACTAGAIDLSLSTGCNIPQFMDGVIP